MSHENSQHIVVVGTKPDIIKQAPIYHELRDRGHDVVLCHTGQHYDHNLSQSMLDEFGVREDINLEVRGGVNDLVSGITAKLALYLRGFAERGGFPITYVHGDTTTAMAGARSRSGFDAMKRCPSATISPHDAVGGTTPFAARVTFRAAWLDWSAAPSVGLRARGDADSGRAFRRGHRPMIPPRSPAGRA